MNPLNLTDHDFNGLIQLGFLAQALGPFHNLTMLDTVNAILATPSINVTELLGPSLRAGGSDVDPLIPLEALTLVLKEVPHDNLSFENVSGYVILTGVTVAMFMLRLYSRKFVTKRIRPEDWVMFFATAVAVALGLCFALGSDISVGMGTSHIWDLSFDQFKNYLKWLWICELLYPLALFFVKSSLLVFYWCLTPSSSHIFRRFVSGFFGLNIICLGVSLGTIIWQCVPVDYWNDPIGAKCIDRVASFLAGSILIIITDVLTLILPIPLVLNLKLPVREKVTVIGMFLLGSAACIASINRIVRVKAVTDADSADITYFNAHNSSGIWSLLEVDLAIIASCAPAIKAIWMKQAVPRMFASAKTSGASSSAAASDWMGKKGIEEDTIELKSVSVANTIIDDRPDTSDGEYVHFSRPFHPDDPKTPAAVARALSQKSVQR